ncbi:MAG TPA: hypothetical protein VN520_31485 [Streptomyces sp.]|uniref:hypothetical protein n=1 Tax=Streptomyces sp. TaxID=1931 RepID=UPI002D1D5C60|nr:hypothetical protein [Streptomyces sp.]HWU10825.1 hypothetical protein [Streptomyces sp.]
MSALTFMDVAEVDLGKLGTAVTDWKKAVDNLKTLARSADTGMYAKSESARWDGVNASVTRAFVKKTRKEFADAYAQANTIWRLLDDAHTELVAIQNKMKNAVEVDIVNLGVKIEDIGDGAVRWFFPHVRGDTDERTQEQLDKAQELADRISSLTAHAMEIDAAVTRALNKAHGTDSHNFGHKNYDSLDGAQAERALELAERGTGITEKEFTEFNRIMKYNAKDSDFSTSFYRGIGGPKEALEFYGQMSLNGTEGSDKDRLALTRDLQRNMGVALASATDPDNKSHLPTSWGAEFRKLGNRQLVLSPGGVNHPYGYQVLGGLLRYGNYDARFLNPIAEHIVQLHHKDPDKFMLNKPDTGGGDLDYGFNPSGRTGAGYDPLTSAMEALGHSPEAAKKFFSEGTVPTVYKEDGTVDKSKSLDYSYFEELTGKDFKWPPDSLEAPSDEAAEKARSFGPDALGHALEAATTGHAWDATTPVLHRDEQTSEIMRKVVNLYSATSDVAPHDEIRDSLGRMGAAYIDDLNYSIKNFGGSGDELDRDGLFAHASDGSSRTDFGEDAALNFMMVAAGDEEGYQYLSASQQVFEASGLAAFENDQAKGLSFADNASKVHGILDEARSHQIREDFKDPEEQRNLEEEKKGEWRKFGVSAGVATVVGVGTALVVGPAAGVVAATAVPLLMETGGGAVNTAYGSHTLQYLKDNEYKNDHEAVQGVQTHERIAERGAWIPVANYADTLGMTTEQKDVLSTRVEQSYQSGKDMVEDLEKVN